MTELGRPVHRYWDCLVQRGFVGLVHSPVFWDYCSEGQWLYYQMTLSRLTRFKSGRQMRSPLVLLRLSSCARQCLGMVFPNVGGKFLDLGLFDTSMILQFSSTPRYLVHLGIVLLGSKCALHMV
jgi:hypothetical protein